MCDGESVTFPVYTETRAASSYRGEISHGMCRARVLALSLLVYTLRLSTLPLFSLFGMVCVCALSIDPINSYFSQMENWHTKPLESDFYLLYSKSSNSSKVDMCFLSYSSCIGLPLDTPHPFTNNDMDSTPLVPTLFLYYTLVRDYSITPLYILLSKVK